MKPIDSRLMFFNYTLWPFEPSQEQLQQWLSVFPALWETLPCESVILILQLVDKTDQGVLQVGHLTDERLQGQLQLLLLSLKIGRKDKGWGQNAFPRCCGSIYMQPRSHLSYRDTTFQGEQTETLERKILWFHTDPPSSWVRTLRQETWPWDKPLASCPL